MPVTIHCNTLSRILDSAKHDAPHLARARADSDVLATLRTRVVARS